MIWVAQEPRGEGIDLTVLQNYANGKCQSIHYIYTKGFNISQHLSEAAATAENFAARFDFRRDRVVLAGGDPLAGMVIAIALTHEAIAIGAKSFGSLRYVRVRDATGMRTLPLYIPIEIPTCI